MLLCEESVRRESPHCVLKSKITTAMVFPCNRSWDVAKSEVPSLLRVVTSNTVKHAQGTW